MQQVALTCGFEEFDAIVRAGSISAAARMLGVPRPSLSRRLAKLEDRLGTRLVRRHSRRLLLTDAGEEFHQRVQRVLDEARAAHDAVVRPGGVPRGRVFVAAAPGGFTNAAVVSFMVRCPEVAVHVTTTAQHVDLVKGGYDVAVREGATADERLTGHCLWQGDFIGVASPGYLEARGVPRTPSDLLGHECIVGFAGGTHLAASWPLFGGGEVPIAGRLVADDPNLQISAAIAGIGIILAPRPLVSGGLTRRELVEVLPGLLGRHSEMTLVNVERELQPRAVQAFIEHVVESISANG